MVLESTVAGRWFEINVNTDGREPMIYTPETQQGSFFNDQEREVRSVQWIEALSLSRSTSGVDSTSSSSASISRTPVTTARVSAGQSRFAASMAHWPSASSQCADDAGRHRRRAGGVRSGSLAPRITGHAGAWHPHGSRGRDRARELVTPRRRVGGRVARRTRHSPWRRGPLPAANAAQCRRLRQTSNHASRHGLDRTMQPLGPPVTFVNVPAPDLRTPEAVAGNVEWNQRFGRRVLFKANYLRRQGSHEYILEPDPSSGEVRLSSTGTSRYWELEAHGPLSRERTAGSDGLLRAVARHGRSEQLRSVLRQSSQPDHASERTQPDSHRRAASSDRSRHDRPAGSVGFRPGDRGSFGVPVVGGQRVPGLRRAAKSVRASAESAHARLLRCPVPGSSGSTGSAPALRVYNIFGASAERDVQSNITSPDFGRFFNPLERSVGFVLGSAK